MSVPQLKFPVLVVIALVLHTAVLSAINIDDVRPDLMLLVAVAAGLVSGPERGAIAGFVAGLASDLFLQTPLGLSAMAFALVAFAVGQLQGTILRAAFWIAPLTALVGSAAGVLLYALIGAVVGQPQLVTPRLGVVVAVVSLANALIAGPVVRVVRWSLSPLPEGIA